MTDTGNERTDRDRGRRAGRTRRGDRAGPAGYRQHRSGAGRAPGAGSAVQPGALVHDRHHRARAPCSAAHRRDRLLRRPAASVPRVALRRPNRRGVVRARLDRVPGRHPAGVDGRDHRPAPGSDPARVRVPGGDGRRAHRHDHLDGAGGRVDESHVRPRRRRGRGRLRGAGGDAPAARRFHGVVPAAAQLPDHDRARPARRPARSDLPAGAGHPPVLRGRCDQAGPGIDGPALVLRHRNTVEAVVHLHRRGPAVPGAALSAGARPGRTGAPSTRSPAGPATTSARR